MNMPRQFRPSARAMATSGFIAAALIAMVPAAHAQQADAATQTPENRGDIVVTTERRKQSVRDIPASITAFGETQLRDLRVNQASDLTKLTSGLTVRVSGGGSDPQFTVRGVGMNSSDVNQNPAVTTYLNDIALPSIAMAGLQLYDLERAEVLKGPQGTLYGRNTTGGAVNLITKRPTQQLSVDGRADFGALNLRDIEGGIGGGITSTLAARAAFSIYQRDGWQTLVLGPRAGVTNTRNGDIDRKSGRLTLAWKPAPNIDVLLVGDYGETHDQAMAYKQYGNLKTDGSRTFCSYVTTGVPNDGACGSYSIPRTGIGGTATGGVNIYADTNPNPRTVGASFIYGNPNHVQTGGFSLKVDAKLGAVDVTSVSGWRKFHRLIANDDGSPYVLSDALRNQSVEVYQQEVRFSNGDKTSPLSWIAGGYFTRDFISGLDRFDQSDQYAYSAEYSSYFRQRTDALAAFGQLDWRPTSRLTFAAGGRYTGERKSIYYNGTVVGTGAYSTPVKNYTNQINAEKATWRVTAKWAPTRDFNIYGNISTGFKGGGFPGTIAFSTGQLTPFAAETMTAYEVGTKMALFDRKVQINLAGYYYDWKNFQATTQVNVNGLPLVILASAGNARIKGLDGDIAITPFAGLMLRAAGNYSDARIVSGQYNGQIPPNTPKLTTTFMARYEMPIAALNATPYVQGDMSYNTSTYVALANAATVLEPALLLGNLRAGVKLRNGMDIAGWVRNVGDKLYRTSILGSGSASLPARATFGDPRTWGISLGYHF
jgi:iron complex outermembrane receptor protein